MVKVRGSVAEVDGKFVEGPPKSEAGRRDVAIPERDRCPSCGRTSTSTPRRAPDGRVFVGPTGAIPRRTNFQATWRKAVEAAGVPGLHFHDLRHTGNMLAAESASLRELMARMGHSSTRAALIYQHASRDRERAIGPPCPPGSRPPVQGRGARKGHGHRDGPGNGPVERTREAPLTWAGALRAGDGNRTRIVSLGRVGASACNQDLG